VRVEGRAPRCDKLVGRQQLDELGADPSPGGVVVIERMGERTPARPACQRLLLLVGCGPVFAFDGAQDAQRVEVGRRLGGSAGRRERRLVAGSEPAL
jgi:hypothetical protein